MGKCHSEEHTHKVRRGGSLYRKLHMASRIYPPAPSPATGRRLSSRVGTLPDPTAALLCNFHEQKSMDSTDARGNLPAASRVLARAAVRGAYQSRAKIRHPHRSSIHIRQATRAKCCIQGASAVIRATRIIRCANAFIWSNSPIKYQSR